MLREVYWLEYSNEAECVRPPELLVSFYKHDVPSATAQLCLCLLVLWVAASFLPSESITLYFNRLPCLDGSAEGYRLQYDFIGKVLSR